MSRSGYCDDIEQWELIQWRGAVSSALRGKRGQEFLRELLAGLDAMPEKRLIANDLIREGEVCTLGVIGQTRGVDISTLDPEDSDHVAKVFDIAPAMAKEIVFMNDEFPVRTETPEQRWLRMRAWVAAQIREEEAA